MSTLHLETCTACSIDADPVSEMEFAELIQQLPLWHVVSEYHIRKLRRTFLFNNFALALDFTNQVGELAESVGHHPDILTQWGKTTVTWWTHAINNLHRTDFICAARTDKLFDKQ